MIIKPITYCVFISFIFVIIYSWLDNILGRTTFMVFSISLMILDLLEDVEPTGEKVNKEDVTEFIEVLE